MKTVLFYRKTTKTNKYVLALAFSMDEINRNPDLLPNMSLVIKHTLSYCDGNTAPHIFKEKIFRPLPNYICNEETMCSFLLIGLNWMSSISLFKDLDIFLFPRVSYHRQEILHIISPWETLIDIKKING